jgi:formate dehydrogenase iron-sulfur subunit
MSTTTAFLTDSTLCIGCKACEVACKEWNGLAADGFNFSGNSYDNTGALGHSTWRHVKFVEKAPEPGLGGNAGEMPSWTFSSDVCKHCAVAGCLEACPTGAIIRTEFDTVYVQPDICNGCGYCIVNCPFGVIDRREEDGRAWKCTLCYDRLREDMTPACAKACPTESIQFGELTTLREHARERVEKLRDAGLTDAYLYGADAASQPGTEGLNAFFLLIDKPEVYNLPPDPVVPTKKGKAAWISMAATAAAMAMVAAGAALFGSKDGTAS